MFKRIRVCGRQIQSAHQGILQSRERVLAVNDPCLTLWVTPVLVDLLMG